MCTMLEIASVLLLHWFCLGKVHPVPAFASKRRLPGKVCRFNSPQLASFDRRFKLRGDGPESPATYIGIGGAASDRAPAFMVRSVKLPGRQQGDLIMEWEGRLRKDGKYGTGRKQGNVVEIRSWPFNRESTARKKIQTIVVHPRSKVVEIRSRTFMNAT